MSPKENRPSPSLYGAVALISASVLGYEVALTRVFAVLLRYQFAFLVISLALCGLGLGGLCAHLAARRGKRFAPETAALTFGVSAAVALAVILRLVFAYRPDQYWVAALIVLVPFGAAGAFLSEVFSRFPAEGGRLYAWDLAGAALAAAGSVALMQFCGAIDACLVFAAMGGLAAVYATPALRPGVIVSALGLTLLWPLNQTIHLWSVQPIPPMPIASDFGPLTLADRGITQSLFTELGDPLAKSRIMDTRWNAFARTDVVADPGAPNSYLLYTNGNVPTNMLGWDGKSWSLPDVVASFPLSNWTFEGSNLRDGNVLSIGPGGGLDALLALRYGAKSFDGAEINPSIIGLMNEPKYRNYNGGIYSNPKIHVRTAEGRAFVREQVAAGKRYRLVFSALTKTATAGQGMALLESFIYTQDAFHDYLNALEDGGTLAIVGDAPTRQPVLLARLFATGVQELKNRGLTEVQAGQCIAVVYCAQPGPYQWALLVRKTPFPRARTFDLQDSAVHGHLTPWWIPNQSSANDPFPFAAVLQGQIPLAEFESYYQADGIDLAPCPDNRPFVLDLLISPFSVFRSSPSLSILLGLAILGTFGLAGWSLNAIGSTAGTSELLLEQEAVLAEVEPPQARQRAGNGLRPVIYFLALGVGFMLVEIPLIQKLILPLGYPTLSLTVILFSLLLGGGGGALFSQRYDGEGLRRHALLCAGGVAVGALLFGSVAAPIGQLMLGMDLTARCALAVALLLPLGFLMGTPFPSGIRLFGIDPRGESGHSGDAVPLIWALNGTASVVGSMAAAVGAKVGGFSAVLLAGAVIYALAALLLASHKTEAGIEM